MIRRIPGVRFSRVSRFSTRTFVDEAPPPTYDTGCTYCMPSNMDMFVQPTKSTPPTPFHTRHVVIHTGHSDWPSRLQDDQDSLIAKLTPLRRMFQSPDSTVLVHNSDLPTGSLPSAHVYPDNLFFDRIQSAELFAEAILGGQDPASFPALSPVRVKNPMVLICGHGNRDERCGVIAPLLVDEFSRVLENKGMLYDQATNPDGVLVGKCSHVGGHAFAGNVIIHDGAGGEGVWYSRVFPHHVQGLVVETLENSRVVKSLARK